MSAPVKSLIASGTKLWLDSIDPDLVRENREWGATGATSNPVIVSDLIKTGRFDSDIERLLAEGLDDSAIAWQLTDQLVRRAQDVFLPVWQATSGNDGYVSFELDPLLEDLQLGPSHAERIARYIELGKKWSSGHQNRMIKVPATPAGIGALEELAAAGLTLNVTLIFTSRQYQAARNAVWRGAQRRNRLEHFKSVYSIFVSRVDIYTEKHVPDLSPAAQGQVGIVNAKRIWEENRDFWRDKKLPLAQEMIFASTGTKKTDRCAVEIRRSFRRQRHSNQPPRHQPSLHRRQSHLLFSHRRTAAARSAGRNRPPRRRAKIGTSADGRRHQEIRRPPKIAPGPHRRKTTDTRCHIIAANRCFIERNYLVGCLSRPLLLRRLRLFVPFVIEWSVFTLNSMLSGITMTCFAASYAVTLAVEFSRLFFRARIRTIVNIGFAAAGLVAHTLYLIAIVRNEAAAGGNVAPLSSWYDWCLIVAWVVAATYFGLAVRRTENAVGVFLLPLVLALIGVAALLYGSPPFPREKAVSYWLIIHGVALLMGTVAVTLGFAAGVMYLAQSYRLKNKLPPNRGFKLPSLEWLQRINKRSLLFSTGLLAIGLLSGIVLNVARGSGSVPWTDPVVVSSAVLLAWLIIATLFEYFYKPARQGRKVAYLTLASFIFLCLVMGFVLRGKHASAKPVRGAVAVGWVEVHRAPPSNRIFFVGGARCTSTHPTQNFSGGAG